MHGTYPNGSGYIVKPRAVVPDTWDNELRIFHVERERNVVSLFRPRPRWRLRLAQFLRRVVARLDP